MISNLKRETVHSALQTHSITSESKLFFSVKSRYLCIKHVDKWSSRIHAAMDSGMNFRMSDEYLYK